MFLKNIGLVFGNSNIIKLSDIIYINIDNNNGQNYRSYEKPISCSEMNVYVDKKKVCIYIMNRYITITKILSIRNYRNLELHIQLKYEQLYHLKH